MTSPSILLLGTRAFYIFEPFLRKDVSDIFFLWCCSAMIEGKQSVNKYLKYSPDDLERMLNDLFEGKSRQEPRARQ